MRRTSGGRLAWPGVLVLILLLGVLAACGEQAPSEPPREAESPPPTEPPAADHHDVVENERDEPAEEEETDAAAAAEQEREHERNLAGLTSEDAAVQRDSIEALLAAGWTHEDLVRLSLRHVRLGEDRGALARMLSLHPSEVLPVILHRVGHSSSGHRAQLCRALSHPVADRDPALAILVVRSLLEPDERARTEARVALGVLSPPASAVVRAHDALYPKAPDGSASYISSGLLLGPAVERGHYGTALRAALRTEGDRFTAESLLRVASFFSELGEPYDEEGAKPAPGVLTGPAAWRAAGMFAAAGPHGVEALGELLRRRQQLPTVTPAVGMIGREASSLGPDLVALLRAEISIRTRDHAAHAGRGASPIPRVLWALARLDQRDAQAQGTLVDLLESDLSGSDRRHVETALRIMQPSAAALARLLEHVEAWPQVTGPAARSAMQVVGWCAEEERVRVTDWVTRAAPNAGDRVDRMRLQRVERALLRDDRARRADRAKMEHELHEAARGKT